MRRGRPTDVTAPDGTALGPLARAEARLAAALGWALVALMAGMIVVVSMQIASRYLLDLSLIWSEEVARLTFISIVFLGAALLARGREHLAVTAVVDLLPDRARHLMDAAVAAVSLLCASYLLRGAWATLLREWDQRTPGLQFPMGAIFALVLASCALLVAWLALALAASLSAAARGTPHARGGIPGEGDGPT